MSDEYPTPQCKDWLLGNFFVAPTEERGDLVKYELAILVTFKSVADYRAALRYMSPIFSGESSNDSSQKEQQP